MLLVLTSLLGRNLYRNRTNQSTYYTVSLGSPAVIIPLLERQRTCISAWSPKLDASAPSLSLQVWRIHSWRVSPHGIAEPHGSRGSNNKYTE